MANTARPRPQDCSRGQVSEKAVVACEWFGQTRGMRLQLAHARLQAQPGVAESPRVGDRDPQTDPALRSDGVQPSAVSADPRRRPRSPRTSSRVAAPRPTRSSRALSTSRSSPTTSSNTIYPNLGSGFTRSPDLAGLQRRDDRDPQDDL